MRYDVVFDESALDDLERIESSIRERSGDRRTSEGYVERIVARCLDLADVPQRGTAHDAIEPGLRTMGFERRVTIAFKITDKRVVVLRILYGGRSSPLFQSDR